MAKEIIILCPATVDLTLTEENEMFYSGMNLKMYVMQRYYLLYGLCKVSLGHGIPFNYIFHEGEIAITKIMGALRR